MLRPAFCAAAFVAALLRYVRFLRPAMIACVRFALRVFCRVLKEKGEPRGENDHGSFPLVLSGQMSAAGCTHDPRFLSRQAELQESSFNKYERASRAAGRISIKF